MTARTTPPPVEVREEPKPAPVIVSSALKPEIPKLAPPKKEEPKPVAKAPATPAPVPKSPTPSPTLRVSPFPSPSLPISASPKLPQELATLDEQFKKLQSERVTAPFEADLAKLNTGYLGGLDRKLAEEKTAGHLDSVLSIEEEKKRMQGVMASSHQPNRDGRLAAEPRSEPVPPCPIPSAEDDATSTLTPAVLKALRQIYRDAYAKIEAASAANLKALTDPLTARLKTLESDFTKKDRIADAKAVKEYREGLAESSPELQLGQASPASKGTETPPRADGLKPITTLASKDGFTNSLGMKFVKVPGTKVMFCIHETRKGDYAAFAAENPEVDASWKITEKDGILAGLEDARPVFNVSWEDGQKFCQWLSKKEGRTYRLPTDREWSFAVGIGHGEKWTKGTTPESLNGKLLNEFPWGGDYPPKTKDQPGNYADTVYKEKEPAAHVSTRG